MFQDVSRFFGLFKEAHQTADTDNEASSIHHTLGLGPTQAAKGNHQHSVVRSKDTWHKVGEPNEPGFLNSWASAGPGAFFRKDAAGNVHLRGFVSGGASGTVAFILPVGYRPTDWSEYLNAEGLGTTNTMQISIASTGEVYLTSVTGATPSRWGISCTFSTE